MKKEYDIFINYRRVGGKEFARMLQLDLERRGYKVFLDFDELTDGKFDQRIMDAIESAPIFISLLSTGSLDRCVSPEDWVRREIEYAIALDRQIVPINPDHQFTDFPADLPPMLRKGLGQHQISEVMLTGSLFKVTMDKLVDERIATYFNRRKSTSDEVGAIFHLDVDLPCRVLKFKKEIAEAAPDEDVVIRLRKGRHQLEFVSVADPRDHVSLLQEVEDNDMEDMIQVRLIPLRDRRVAEERERANRLEAERKQKAEEERKRREEEGKRESDLAENYYFGNNGYKVDIDQSAEHARKAAELGDAGGQYRLGYFYEYGKSVPQDYKKAAELYRLSADQGFFLGQYFIGHCYEEGRGVPQDYAQAMEWYLKSAAQGYRFAEYKVGDGYFKAWGVPQDDVKAAEWYRKSAEKGTAYAQLMMGECYYFGYGVKKDYSEAAKWYRKSADQGNVKAQFCVGRGYHYGHGLPQNYGEAVKWYEKACTLSEPRALNNLGYCYENGCGVEKNYEKALDLFYKAARNGSIQAKNNIGSIYFNGRGVPQDYNKAVLCFQEPAKAGNIDAQYNYAICFELGRGVVQNYARAVEWYGKAAEQGDKDAIKKVEILRDKIPSPAYAIYLKSVGKEPVKVSEKMQEIFGFGVGESATMRQSAPCELGDGYTRACADQIKKMLEEVGAVVEIR